MAISSTTTAVCRSDRRAVSLARRRFGKDSHLGALNVDDCFAGALARTKNEPLLLKGEDFAQTEIEAA